MDKILVLAAHPDDETLGCGGLKLKPHHYSNHLIRGLVTLRGPQSGVGYAEGFEVIRLFS